VPFPTAAEVAARFPAVGLSNAEIGALIAEFVEVAERYRGVALEPRTATDTFRNPGASVQLARWPVRSLASATADGDPLVVADLDYSDTGIVSGLPDNAGTVTVTYSHGIDTPAVAARACAEYVRAVALAERSGTSRDVIAQSFDGGFTRYSTPDWNRGRPTGFLEVDRLLDTLPDYRVPGVG
jgi:hypothetical protein